MASGPVDGAWMARTALREGFEPTVFEQAWRIAHLLGEIGAHGYLRGRLAFERSEYRPRCRRFVTLMHYELHWY